MPPFRHAQMRGRCERATVHRRFTAVLTVLTAFVAAAAVSSTVPTAARADASTGTGGMYVSLTQTNRRVLDTRPAYAVGNAGTGSPIYNTPMPVGAWRTVQVTGQYGLAGLPTSGVAAIAVTFTAENHSADGWLKADKYESPANGTATYLFWKAGQQTSNSGVLSVSTDGKIQVAALGSTTDLFIDVEGYYTAGDPTAGGFVPVSQTRLADTRTGADLQNGVGQLAAGSTTRVNVGGQAGVPANASAVMVNFLVVYQTGAGRINPYPADQPSRPATALEYGADGSYTMTEPVELSAATASQPAAFNVYAGVSSTDFAVDVLGYFTASTGGGAFTPAKTRIIDTRTNNATLAGGASRTVQIASTTGTSGVDTGVPASGVAAVVLDVATFDDAGTSDGWVHVWPDATTEPNPSAGVVYHAGDDLSNLYTVALGADGAIRLHNMGSDAINYAIDVEGWYSPASVTPIAGSALCVSASETDCMSGQYTTTLTPGLAAVAYGPSAVSYGFEVYAGSDGAPTSPAAATGSITSQPSGSTVSWPVPTGSLADNSVYEYRARSYDAVSTSAWSPFHVFVTDAASMPSSAATLVDANGQPYTPTSDADANNFVDSFWTQSRMDSAIDITNDANSSVASTPASAPAQSASETSDSDAVAAASNQTTMAPSDISDPNATPDATLAKGNLPSGKLFMYDALLQKDYVCSASVINTASHEVLVTAGHCLYSGQSSTGGNQPRWWQNVRFVPQYKNGVRPYGTWHADYLAVTYNWYWSGGPVWSTNTWLGYQHDFGMVLLKPGGTSGTSKVQDVVGANGWAYNVSHSYTGHIFGYPKNYNNGQVLKACVASVGNDSNGLGLSAATCNFAGGASGGPWLAAYDGSTGYGQVRTVTSTYNSVTHENNGAPFNYDFKKLLTLMYNRAFG